MGNIAVTPFWKTTPLEKMTREEWESLCDGCGQCCLHKLQDEDTDEIAYTNVACRLLDLHSCRCRNYDIRKLLVPDCVVLSPDQVAAFSWLPTTCAYRLIAEGRDLYPWHPLISGNPDSVHEAGISVRGKAISERDAGELEDHVVEKPLTAGEVS
ncbi:YcgN family cysteine cluster protein [Luteithermobacter gelatinilyticus]|uniref:YcgN family cysteine cluster protein n=1 Tax=Luteithermobacter gelatinilyticus TaxID=2582913 RepID=UPI0011073B42|nr:YcgN family cysteine cluster protein [Luteithermobacter gelatinilyticus]|tara:strand:- start:1418 stop:1882 length:465 start_codon:yes stop_codon:yes gene_type:complete